MSYRIFRRNWWREAEAKGEWPNDLEPHAGTKHHIKYVSTEEEARAFCRRQNAISDPGRYSMKCEYEER